MFTQLVFVVMLHNVMHFGDGQLEDKNSHCTIGYLFVAQDTVNGVLMTAKSIISQLDTQHETIFSGDSIPKECGDGYIRCNLTVLCDFATRKIVGIVPLTRGVGLVLYDLESGTGNAKYLDHFVIDLKQNIPSYNCAVTSFFRVAETAATASRILGLCLNTSNEEQSNLQIVQLEVDFNTLNQSTLSAVQYGWTGITLNFPHDISKAIYFYPPAACFEDENLSLFFIDGTSLVDLNLVTGVMSYYEMYSAMGTHAPTLVDCIEPKQLIRVSDHTLVVYCENSTIELNLCIRRSTTILVDTYNEGMRFYCNNDLSTHINIQDGILTVQTTDPLSSFNDLTFRLPPDFNAIHSASCLIISNIIYVVVSLADGKTNLINLNGGFATQIGMGSPNETITHTVYDHELVFFNDASSSLLYNLSCSDDQNQIDHPFHLSAYFQDSNNVYTCVCNSSNHTTNISTVSLYTPDPSGVVTDAKPTDNDTTATYYTLSSTVSDRESETIDPSITSNGQSSLYVALAAGLGFLGGMIVCIVFVIVVLVAVQRFVDRKNKRTRSESHDPSHKTTIKDGDAL